MNYRVNLFTRHQADKKTWYRGICEFTKALKQYDGLIVVEDELADAALKTKVVVQLKDNTIVTLMPTSDPFAITSASCIAALPKDSNMLSASTLATDAFIHNTVLSGGASINLM